MRRAFQRLKAYYLRRFRGYVAAPRIAGSRGTAWQEHFPKEVFPGITGSAGQTRETVLFWLFCFCGRRLDFTSQDYFVKSRDLETQKVLEARYSKVCPNCGLGHWMNASKTVTSGW